MVELEELWQEKKRNILFERFYKIYIILQCNKLGEQLKTDNLLLLQEFIM